MSTSIKKSSVKNRSVKFGINRVAEHVRKYLILYTLVFVVLGIVIGYHYRTFSASDKGLMSNLVIFFAILTIYPSMIQLKTEGLLKHIRSFKPIVVSLIYVFVLSPLIAILVAPSFGNASVASGFVVSNVVPASSASMGYVLIAGGSLELATVLAVLSVVVAVPAIPLIMNLYSSQMHFTFPLAPVMTSVLYILILPLIAGQLTRYPIEKFKGKEFLNGTSRKYLSLITMLSMFSLIFVLVFKEASVIVTRPDLVVYLIGFQSLIIVGILILSLIVSRWISLSYEDHQALAMISVSKNQSVAAAIAVLSLSPVAALAPSVIPMIQPVLIIIYIHLEKPVKALFSKQKRVETYA
ncbi:MAG: bile acid:sodium symporter [Candidatus Thermoplasmatota archaeon]|jgi:ACR3 family arsenite transporter|nr:bile acid:sodium symporter [Candidatus Thermoplasmatota archaeon]MCL5789824.1 bile acid:sodium symporter [Candidatus Thermoplasmatota archaeon]